ncbi:CPBP family intramembrane glutamic endopeptidase [Telluribacter sp. SYSU D00476]|uniref:CPBP family intramembrane glutamic endopeptidase n=1 Tax=Telluribacter sp. SYSU D00476 TaxID=2811430 RepID=UPI001FF5D827|nr:CPBP family intramembrane glutamic endopeptidase [Telluribacter sp. SYSU D00476]
MKQRHLWYILLANGLFATVANLLFLIDGIQQLWKVLWQSLLYGMVVYAFQIALTYYLIQKYASRSWLYQPFRARAWAVGLGVGIGLWLLFTGIYTLQRSSSLLFPNSSESFVRFLSIFLFNSLPGALIEEYLFRYLPVRYAESRKLEKPRAWLLYVGVLLLFTVVHIPAYLLRDQVPLSSLWSPFSMGIAFFFVYHTTRNLPFAALFHAFTNNHWFLYGTRDSNDYSIVILASVIWLMLRIRQKQRAYKLKLQKDIYSTSTEHHRE